MGVGSDALELLRDGLGYLYPGSCHFVYLLKIGVVVVEDGPKLKIQKGSLLKFLHYLFFLTFESHFRHEIQEFFSQTVFNQRRQHFFEIRIFVVLIECKFHVIDHKQSSESNFILTSFVGVSAVLQLYLTRNGGQLVPCCENHLHYVVYPH